MMIIWSSLAGKPSPWPYALAHAELVSETTQTRRRLTLKKLA